MQFAYYFITFVIGMSLTLQVGINGRLQAGLESPVLAAAVSFGVGLVGLAAAYLVLLVSGNEAVPSLGTIHQIPWWMWGGGLIGAAYIYSATILPGKIGFGQMFSLIVAGQVIMAILFDHFGLLGSPVHPVNPLRILGVLLLIVGVVIIQNQ